MCLLAAAVLLLIRVSGTPVLPGLGMDPWYSPVVTDGALPAGSLTM